MTMWGEKGTLKGRYWKLSNGNWVGRNSEGTQRICRIQVEAQRFAEKKIKTTSKPKILNESPTPKFEKGDRVITGLGPGGGKVIKVFKVPTLNGSNWTHQITVKWDSGKQSTESPVDLSHELNEWTVSDVQLAMRKSGKYDSSKIDKLRKLAHVGNVTLNDLKKVGLGSLKVWK